MRTAELEKRTGVNRHTLRFYEREGLLVSVRRDVNNYRDYPEAAEREVNLVRQLQSLGFSLKEVREVLEAMRTGAMDCVQGARLMAEKRALVEARIVELRQASRLLAEEQQRLEESAERLRATGQC